MVVVAVILSGTRMHRASTITRIRTKARIPRLWRVIPTPTPRQMTVQPVHRPLRQLIAATRTYSSGLADVVRHASTTMSDRETSTGLSGGKTQNSMSSSLGRPRKRFGTQRLHVAAIISTSNRTLPLVGQRRITGGTARCRFRGGRCC